MQLLCWNNLSHLFLQLMLPHRTHSHIAKSVTLDQKNVSGFLIKFFWTPIRWDSYHLHFLIVLLLWPVYSFSKWLNTCDRCVCARVCVRTCVCVCKEKWGGSWAGGSPVIGLWRQLLTADNMWSQGSAHLGAVLFSTSTIF